MIIEPHIREKILKDIYMEVDGFYVWSPAHPTGFFTEGSLLMIVHILQEMNKEWDEQINKYFKEQDAN